MQTAAKAFSQAAAVAAASFGVQNADGSKISAFDESTWPVEPTPVGFDYSFYLWMIFVLFLGVFIGWYVSSPRFATLARLWHVRIFMLLPERLRCYLWAHSMWLSAIFRRDIFVFVQSGLHADFDTSATTRTMSSQ